MYSTCSIVKYRVGEVEYCGRVVCVCGRVFAKGHGGLGKRGGTGHRGMSACTVVYRESIYREPLFRRFDGGYGVLRYTARCGGREGEREREREMK